MNAINPVALIDRIQKDCSSDGYTSYPSFAARLEVELIELATRLNTVTGANAVASKGCRLATVYAGDANFLVEYEYNPGRPGKMYLRNGDPGYPDEPAELAIVQVFVNGHWIDPGDLVDDKIIAKWEEQIGEQIADENAAADDAEYEALRRLPEEEV